MKCCSRGRQGGRLFAVKCLILVLLIGSLSLLLLQFNDLRDSHYTYIKSALLQKLSDAGTFPEPRVDTNFNFSEAQLMQAIEERMPNLPMVYWNKNKKDALRFNTSCAPFPDILKLEFNSVYWQTLETTNGTFQLFGAYLDVRKNNMLGPTVRILGMLNRIQPAVKTYCQMWFEGEKEPALVKTLEYKYVWFSKWGNYKNGIYQPYLIACKIPLDRAIYGPSVTAVSLVEKPCDTATNLLKVIYNKPQEPKKDFAVCVKGLDFPHLDLSVKLAEWIELLNLLGADKIFLYELGVHPNVSKLLRYYEDQGKVHVTPLLLAGGQPNGPFLQHYFLKKKIIHKRQSELIPYNDCFYKHMYEYKFIVLLDTDEVIMPVEGNSWKELMDTVLQKAAEQPNIQRASFNVRNVYFLDDLLHDHGWFQDVPRYMHMLQHVYRTKNFTKPGAYIKSFFNTEKVLTLHNHFPLACLGNCFSYPVDTSDAQLQHYRSDCVNDLKKSCKNFRNSSVMDTTIWKFKKPLIQRVSSTLKALGYFSNT